MWEFGQQNQSNKGNKDTIGIRPEELPQSTGVFQI
jgi:hypothetical protein